MTTCLLIQLSTHIPMSQRFMNQVLPVKPRHPVRPAAMGQVELAAAIRARSLRATEAAAEITQAQVVQETQAHTTPVIQEESQHRTQLMTWEVVAAAVTQALVVQEILAHTLPAIQEEPHHRTQLVAWEIAAAETIQALVVQAILAHTALAI